MKDRDVSGCVAQEEASTAYVTMEDVKHESLQLGSARVCSDREGSYIRISVSSLPTQRQFLFVRKKGLDIGRASVRELKGLLEEVQGAPSVASVFLENVPNENGTSCWVCRSEVYLLLESEPLSDGAGRGARILSERFK